MAVSGVLLQWAQWVRLDRPNPGASSRKAQEYKHVGLIPVLSWVYYQGAESEMDRLGFKPLPYQM